MVNAAGAPLSTELLQNLVEYKPPGGAGRREKTNRPGKGEYISRRKRIGEKRCW